MATTLHVIEDLAERFLGIARNKLTGTLLVHAEGDRKRQFFFQQGSLADIDTGRPDTLLEAALRDSGVIGEKEIKRARKSMGAEKTLGAAILDLGIVPEADVAENIRRRLTEEVCEVFDWPLDKVEFFEHEADERLESFYSELTEYYEALADAEEVFLEAAKRLDRWDLVGKHFAVLHDVFYATPSSFRYFREQAKYPDEYAIVSAVDGIKDADELISQSGLDPFVAVNLLRKLRASGELELINPVQMFQLGVEFSGSGNFEKACKLFRRAMERGLDDFDILQKLAQTLDSLDRVEDAVARYVEFGDKCMSQSRLDDAARSLKRAIELDRGSVPAHEKYLEVLLEQKRQPEAAEEAMALADLKVVHRDERGALETLLRVREGNPQASQQLQQKIIALAEATRNWELARKEKEELARKTEQRRDAESEIERYQRRFCEGDDSLPVRTKLAELHLAKGNRPKALEHINAILNLPEKYKVKDEATLLLLHEAVREMKPADLRSNRWLADYHNRKGDKSKAVAVLQSWIASLEREADMEEVVHAYERLLAIDDSSDHRWGLAMALEKINRPNESRRELRSLANLALRKKDFDQATRALDHIMKSAPLDLETRKMQADLLEAREKRISARKKHEEIALLAMLAGNMQDAEQYCRRLPADRPQTAEMVRKLGNLCHEQGDRQKAIEQLRKAVKLHLEHKNFGLAKLALQEILVIDPANPDGAAILTELKARETPPPAPAAAAPAAGPAPKPEASAGAAPAAGPAPAAAAPPQPPPAAPQTTPPKTASVHVGRRGLVAEQADVAAQAEAPVPPPSAPEEKDASPHLRYEREPFQPAAPVVTRVSGITAKLKRLKTAPAESAQPRSVQVQVKDITSKLRNMKDGDGSTPAPAGEGVKPMAPAALKTAASRLKALAGKKAEEVSVADDPSPTPASAEPEASTGTAPEAPPAATQPRKLTGAAAKLAGLRKSEEPRIAGVSAPAQTKRPGSVVIKIGPGASGGGGTGPTAPLSDDQAARLAGSAAAGEVRQAKLNTSASKLAELRKKKAETQAG